MEQYRKTIYCDWAFLIALLSKHGDEDSCLGKSFNIDNDVASNIQELLICPNIKLYLNISSDFFYQTLNDVERKCRNVPLSPLEKFILEIDFKQKDNRLHLHFNTSKVLFNDSIIDTDLLNSLFFSSESKEVCTKAMEEYGIIVFCAENINEFKYLTFDQGVALQKTETGSWSRCLGGHDIVPCNSLIIVDNYILNDGERIEENLRKIFDSLIPKSLNKLLPFQVTIFTTLCNDRGISYNSASRLEKVKTILTEIRPAITFNVSIIKCSKNIFHDRTILTNNLYIGCGGGFNLFKNGKAQKTTTICVFHPFLNSHTKWSRKAYSDVLCDTSYVFNKTSAFDPTEMNDSFPNFAIGEKTNRLLKLIK